VTAVVAADLGRCVGETESARVWWRGVGERACTWLSLLTSIDSLQLTEDTLTFIDHITG
jgi:hypothetical protein